MPRTGDGEYPARSEPSGTGGKVGDPSHNAVALQWIFKKIPPPRRESRRGDEREAMSDDVKGRHGCSIGHLLRTDRRVRPVGEGNRRAVRHLLSMRREEP